MKAARERISELNTSLVTEHEQGFYKALRQAEVLLKVEKPLALGFDLEKDVYDGVLTYVAPSAVAEVEVVGEAVAGASGAAADDV